MTDKQFTFQKKEPHELCRLRKYHVQDDYIYQPRKDKTPLDVITRCRECKVWLIAKIEQSPSSRYTGVEAWHMTSRLATSQEIEIYTKLGKVRDI